MQHSPRSAKVRDSSAYGRGAGRNSELRTPRRSTDNRTGVARRPSSGPTRGGTLKQQTALVQDARKVGSAARPESLDATSTSTTRAKSARSARSAWDGASVCSTVGSVSQWRAEPSNAREIGVASIGGVDKGFSKENQDGSFVYQRVQGGADFLCGVIDGHGSDGHRVSEFIQRNLASQIIERRKQASHQGTRAAIANSFVETAAKLGRSRGVDSKESGAAVTVCMRRGQDLYVANVGDARAILVGEDRAGRTRSQPLTKDHKPSLRSERERINKCGGHVAQAFFPGVGYAGPPRVCGQLCVSRAIGDTALKDAGVTPAPEVIKHRITAGDKLVVLASDGCWDHVSNDSAAKIALQHQDPARASQAIVQAARQCWQRDSTSRGYIDDITCLVAKI
eukprot:TRINITY_DN107883_c0_g1_i1.p1 TRINITY_DN107883_c0_g1~~TRINITY_DN107883_c0_g1_i1.p1  ORF type:complete len:395 (+),score=38.00 TRINITY_DN107883_c0_g1_i1:120-1304(+)